MSGAEVFDNFISKNFNDIRKKYKQFCFLNGYTFNDDVLADTYANVKEMLIKKGLKDESEKGIEDYFFKAFKKNTFLAYYNLTKSKITYTDNIIEECKYMCDDNNITERVEKEQYDEFVRNYLLNKIQSVFDSLSCRVWRLKRFVTINQKQLTYEQVRKMTHILDAKKRVIAIDKWIKSNISLREIDEEFNKLCL